MLALPTILFGIIRLVPFLSPLTLFVTGAFIINVGIAVESCCCYRAIHLRFGCSSADYVTQICDPQMAVVVAFVILFRPNMLRQPSAYPDSYLVDRAYPVLPFVGVRRTSATKH